MAAEIVAPPMMMTMMNCCYDKKNKRKQVLRKLTEERIVNFGNVARISNFEHNRENMLSTCTGRTT